MAGLLITAETVVQFAFNSTQQLAWAQLSGESHVEHDAANKGLKGQAAVLSVAVFLLH